VFIRKVSEGSSDRSYGIHVGRLAGLPADVIRRAREILAELELGGKTPALSPGDSVRLPGGKGEDQLSLFADSPSPLEADLLAIDPDSLSPREALDKLYELIGSAQKSRRTEIGD
jgi:DNA mismatch repair protein MutS